MQREVDIFIFKPNHLNHDGLTGEMLPNVILQVH